MLLNKHIREKALDTIASEQMNRKFQANKRSTASSASAAVTGVDLQDVKAAEQAAFMAGRVLTALRDAAAGPAAKAATSASAAPGAAGAGAAAADASAAGADDSEETKESSRGDKALKQIGLTFSELINTIAEAKEADHATSNVRGTRFAHATVFAQEAEESSIASVATGTAAIGGAIGGGNSNSSAAAGGAGGGPSALDIYNSTYNTAFSAALAAGLTANTQASIDARNTALANALAQVKGDLTARKQLMEIEEGVRQEQLLATRNAIEEFTLRVDALLRDEEVLQQSVTVSEAEVTRLQEETDKLEKDCISKRQALELVPSASENIIRLQEVCDKSAQKLRLLEEEWDSVQAPMIEELGLKERQKAARMARVSTMLEEMDKYRELMQPMVADLTEKQQRAEVLQEETSKLNKNLNRALYTHRILDITMSISKQNKEIGKITGDIRDLQKTINQNSNTLHRADAIAEEMIFKGASETNDAVMVDTYRRLKSLRAHFEGLLNALSSIGLLEKAQRDLETKIEVERGRASSMNYERITADLQAILAENQKLLGEVKGLARK